MNTGTNIGHIVEEALRQERIEIARLLRNQADEHTSAARAHDCNAITLNAWADRILARHPAAPEPVEPEPVF